MKPKQNLRMSLLLMMAALMSLVAQAEVRASSTSPPESQRYSFTTAKADDATVVRFVLPGFDRQVVDSATVTERVSVPGLASTAFAGLPALPYKTFKIAPEYSSTPQIVIRDSTYVDYDINLAHNPAVEYDSLGVPHYNDVPCTMYQGFMPSEIARVTDTQIYRGRPIYTITIMPMKYDRALGRLRVFTSLDIDVVYTPGISTQSTTANRSAAFNSYTNRTLSSILGDDYVSNPAAENNDDIATQAGIIGDVDIVPFGLDETEDYLIVTVLNSFDAAVDSLREWKKNLGYRVHSVGSWSWTQQQVQDTIKYFYNTLPNLTNVLIIGTDACVPGNSVVKKLWRPDKAADSTTDFYYMCMDGDNDMMPDVAYGRIPAYCAPDAMSAIQKIIKYEKGLYNDAASYSRAFVGGEYGTDSATLKKGYDRFIPTLEEVRDILQASDITAQRIYNSTKNPNPSVWYFDFFNYPCDSVALPGYLRKPNFMWDGTKQMMIDAFNNGINFGVYNGHGSVKGWAEYDFDYFACQELTSDKSAPLVFSISCSTANHYYYNNCLVAELVRRQYGPIAVIASSNGTYLGWSDALLLGMTDAIWPNKYTYNGWTDPVARKPIYRLYDILSAGHDRLENTQDGGYWDIPKLQNNRYLLYQRVNFHVYGDPSLNYNAYCPTEYNTVSFVLGNYSTTISIGEAELPAKVVLRNLTTDEITTRTITSLSPTIERRFSLPENDTCQIIVSGPNKVPFIKTMIGSSNNPVITPPKGSITDVTYDSSTQTAVVTYSSTKTPTFEVYDFNNNQYIVNTEPILGAKKVRLYLNEVPSGLCVIAMMINGEKVDTYKFTKL